MSNLYLPSLTINLNQHKESHHFTKIQSTGSPSEATWQKYLGSTDNATWLVNYTWYILGIAVVFNKDSVLVYIKWPKRCLTSSPAELFGDVYASRLKVHNLSDGYSANAFHKGIPGIQTTNLPLAEEHHWKKNISEKRDASQGRGSVDLDLNLHELEMKIRIFWLHLIYPHETLASRLFECHESWKHRINDVWLTRVCMYLYIRMHTCMCRYTWSPVCGFFLPFMAYHLLHLSNSSKDSDPR